MYNKTKDTQYTFYFYNSIYVVVYKGIDMEENLSNSYLRKK